MNPCAYHRMLLVWTCWLAGRVLAMRIEFSGVCLSETQPRALDHELKLPTAGFFHNHAIIVPQNGLC